MIKAAKASHLFRPCLLLVLCISMTISLCTLHVKGTTAYITSLSDTCENVFIVDGQAERPGNEKPVSPPEKDTSDQTSAPTTGDRSPVEWALSIALVSVSVWIIIRVWSKKDDRKDERQR